MSYNKDQDLASYRIFLTKFVSSRDDNWPVKNGSYCVEDNEILAEAINLSIQYLSEGQCPTSLVTPIIKNVVAEIQNKDRISTLDNIEGEQNYKVGDIKKLVFDLLKEYCSNLCDNVELHNLYTNIISDNFEAFYSIASSKNLRRMMEDRYVCIKDFNGAYNVQDTYQKVHLYGIFDGHSGYNAACYSAAQLPYHLAKDSLYPTNVVEALRQAFLKTDHNFIKKNIKSGTTALCALHYPQELKLYVAWVGDSKALLAKNGCIMQLVIPHKPNVREEAERIVNQGGSIIPWGGVLRVNGLLNLSRAIGDIRCKPYVISDPDIKCIELDNEEDFLILASDGLWDYVSEEEAAKTVYDFIKIKDDIDPIAECLINLAKEHKSQDNITVIVVFLKKPSLIRKSLNNHVTDITKPDTKISTTPSSSSSLKTTKMDTFDNHYKNELNLDNTHQTLVPNANTEIDLKTVSGKDIFQTSDAPFNDGLNNFVSAPPLSPNDTNNPFSMTTTTTTKNCDITNNDMIIEDKNNVDLLQSTLGKDEHHNDFHNQHNNHHHHFHQDNGDDNNDMMFHNNHNNQQQNDDFLNHHHLHDQQDELSEKDQEKSSNDNNKHLSFENDMGPETSVDTTDDVVMMTNENSAETDLLENSSPLSQSKETLPSSDNMNNPFDMKVNFINQEFMESNDDIQECQTAPIRTPTSPFYEEEIERSIPPIRTPTSPFYEEEIERSISPIESTKSGTGAKPEMVVDIDVDNLQLQTAGTDLVDPQKSLEIPNIPEEFSSEISSQSKVQQSEVNDLLLSQDTNVNYDHFAENTKDNVVFATDALTDKFDTISISNQENMQYQCEKEKNNMFDEFNDDNEQKIAAELNDNFDHTVRKENMFDSYNEIKNNQDSVMEKEENLNDQQHLKEEILNNENNGFKYEPDSDFEIKQTENENHKSGDDLFENDKNDEFVEQNFNNNDMPTTEKPAEAVSEFNDKEESNVEIREDNIHENDVIVVEEKIDTEEPEELKNHENSDNNEILMNKQNQNEIEQINNEINYEDNNKIETDKNLNIDNQEFIEQKQEQYSDFGYEEQQKQNELQKDFNQEYNQNFMQQGQEQQQQQYHEMDYHHENEVFDKNIQEPEIQFSNDNEKNIETIPEQNVDVVESPKVNENIFADSYLTKEENFQEIQSALEPTGQELINEDQISIKNMSEQVEITSNQFEEIENKFNDVVAIDESKVIDEFEKHDNMKTDSFLNLSNDNLTKSNILLSTLKEEEQIIAQSPTKFAIDLNEVIQVPTETEFVKDIQQKPAEIDTKEITNDVVVDVMQPINVISSQNNVVVDDELIKTKTLKQTELTPNNVKVDKKPSPATKVESKSNVKIGSAKKSSPASKPGEIKKTLGTSTTSKPLSAKLSPRSPDKPKVKEIVAKKSITLSQESKPKPKVSPITRVGAATTTTTSKLTKSVDTKPTTSKPVAAKVPSKVNARPSNENAATTTAQKSTSAKKLDNKPLISTRPLSKVSPSTKTATTTKSSTTSANQLGGKPMSSVQARPRTAATTTASMKTATSANATTNDKSKPLTRTTLLKQKQNDNLSKPRTGITSSSSTTAKKVGGVTATKTTLATKEANKAGPIKRPKPMVSSTTVSSTVASSTAVEKNDNNVGESTMKINNAEQ